MLRPMRRPAVGLLVPALALLVLQGCGGSRHRAVPLELQVDAHLAGFPDGLRYFPRSPADIRFMEHLR